MVNEDPKVIHYVGNTISLCRFPYRTLVVILVHAVLSTLLQRKWHHCSSKDRANQAVPCVLAGVLTRVSN